MKLVIRIMLAGMIVAGSCAHADKQSSSDGAVIIKVKRERGQAIAKVGIRVKTTDGDRKASSRKQQIIDSIPGPEDFAAGLPGLEGQDSL